MNVFLVALSLVADAIIGDPDSLWRKVPHPVVLFGNLIGWLDRKFNREDRSEDYRRQAGILSLIILLVISLCAGAIVQSVFLFLPFGWVVLILVASVFIAQKSLYLHVKAVQHGLETGGLSGGRKAVSQIVGRDPDQLDEAGISRAAIESCAENFSDGIVAPAFWFALLGLPGLIAYKAVNTADSMIGYKTARHGSFGWAAARFDDVINWPAARLSAIFIAIAAMFTGGSPQKCMDTCLKDASKHRSPNAGWPECAFAAALDIALAGPRSYGSQPTNDPFINKSGRRELGAKDIGRALTLLKVACAVQIGIYLLLSIVL